ncbi:MAG: hypothetical protein GC171_08415 [Terrimonas sp.]|nr:hypothetical protein [Terrimonas sp.]
MNKVIVLWVSVLFAAMQVGAQTYRIDTSEISFENKLRPCLFVGYDADAKTVKKAWSQFLSKKYKIKTKGIGLFSDKDIISSEDVTINRISDKRMNLYAMVGDVSGGSELKYFMSFGYDFFIGPAEYPDAFKGMKELLNDFSMEFLNDFYADEAARITKDIKKLEREIKSKQRSIQKNNKKAGKESEAVASGLEAKNTSLDMDILGLQKQITELAGELDVIKVKQSGITRN